MQKWIDWAKPMGDLKQQLAGFLFYFSTLLLYFAATKVIGVLATAVPLLKPLYTALHYFFGFCQFLYVIPLLKAAKVLEMRRFSIGMLMGVNLVVLFNLALFYFLYMPA
uniref:Uncharacterized protein n=1 Tax=Magnetococcus massalia (strain MO-1) TaxID=451514 RepID=A0A1S7LJG6_MAGMO|nr:conserved membrane protein of unknown function [Candidatus Magnetococcus massalia]